MKQREQYPWHAPIWKKIDAYFDKNRFPHAMLFWGAKGLGKHNFVGQLAMRLLCLDETNAPCGDCQSCHWISRGTHADNIVLRPAPGKRTIRVDDVRALITKLNRTSHAGHGFVVTVSLLEQMNLEAHNALLKLLEEPSHEVYFLLLSEQITLLPQTIRSRCQTCYFPLQNTETVVSYLKEQNVDSTYAFLLKGAPLLHVDGDHKPFLSLRKETHQSLLALGQGTACPIKTAAVWVKAPIEMLLEILLMCLSDVLKWRLLKTESLLVNQDSLATLKSYSKLLKLSQIMTFLDKLISFKKALLNQSNLNQQLCLEDLAISLYRDGREHDDN